MIHSDILNSLDDNERVILLSCVMHATGKEYQYDELIYFRKSFLKWLLEKYYTIVAKDVKEEYKTMVDKINKSFKSL